MIAGRRGYPREARVPLRQAARIVLTALPAVVTPLIIIVPIAGGWVPAHQAAVIAVVWSALVSTFVYRSLPAAGYGCYAFFPNPEDWPKIVPAYEEALRAEIAQIGVCVVSCVWLPPAAVIVQMSQDVVDGVWVRFDAKAIIEASFDQLG